MPRLGGFVQFYPRTWLHRRGDGPSHKGGQRKSEEPIVYGAYHFVSCFKGFNNSVAYSLKYQIDLLLSAAVLFKILGKAIFRCTDFARR